MAYHRFEAEIERGPYRPYREVLRACTARAAEEIRLPISGDDLDVLANFWEEQPVFDDVAPALRELRSEDWKLAVLTNCDDDLFARTQTTLPVRLDRVVTAQQVRAYKPALAHFRRFDELTKGRAQWIHVAVSWFHDIAPAREYGVGRIWIDRDRTGEDPAAANRVLASLENLCDALRNLDL